jgi:hypothetical protein
MPIATTKYRCGGPFESSKCHRSFRRPQAFLRCINNYDDVIIIINLTYTSLYSEHGARYIQGLRSAGC